MSWKGAKGSGEGMLTFDEVLCLVLAVACSNNTFHDMEITLGLLFRLTLHHVLLVFFGLIVLQSLVVHVCRYYLLEVVVQLPPALVMRRNIERFPRRVIVGLVLPLDLRDTVSTCIVHMLAGH
jgi:hypothetical protein